MSNCRELLKVIDLQKKNRAFLYLIGSISQSYKTLRLLLNSCSSLQQVSGEDREAGHNDSALRVSSRLLHPG